MALNRKKIDELKNYITQTFLTSDKSDEEIQQILTNAGWPKEYVETAFEELNKLEAKEQKKTVHALTASTIMSSEIVKISTEMSVSNIITTIKEMDSGYVLIVEKDKPHGIITGSDIIRHIDDLQKIKKGLKAKDIMTHPITTVDHNTKILDVCDIMKLENIERIPVLKKGKLIGIITPYELIDFFSLN